MRLLLLFFILSSMSFACSGSITQYVPAVVGNGGGLVNVSVSLTPGEGDVYATVYPRTGISTQQSIEQAVSYAYFLSEREPECDVLFDFGSSSGEYIDGPSGGTAFAVMAYALLENKTLRDDTIITGSLDPFGNVGSVGGLYEKASGAVTKKAKYFITPVESFYEVLLLKNVEKEYDIEVLEAHTVEEVIAFMTENKSIEQVPLSSRKRDIPELAPYNYSGMEAFSPVARRMIFFEEELVVSISTEDNETLGIKEFYENEIERQTSILEQGYLFSAANEAFLNYIDISTINAIVSGNADLPRKKGEVGICLTGISRPLITDENFEWVIGADQRQAWAYEKFENTDTQDDLLTDEKFITYHELMYGQAWCNVAKELLEAAPSGGNELNENNWKELAEEKLEEARKMGTTAEDTETRLKIAEKSYEEGRYGAVIFDSVYVIEMEKVDQNILNGTETGYEVSLLLNETRDSLWGRVYQSHAAFLYELNESNGAYTAAMLSKGLEEATNEIVSASNVEIKGEVDEAAEEVDNILLGVVVISLFLFIIVIVLIRRAYGSKRKRYGKTYRTKQKKSRT